MKIVPIQKLLATAAATPGEKHLTGNVTDPARLFADFTWRRLRQLHKGPFAFLAFHPTFDQYVSTYVSEGSLTLDSGPDVLVLLVVDSEVKEVSMSNKIDVPGVDVTSAEHPSYKLIQQLFVNQPAPALPGVVFFDGYLDDHPAVYISLDNLDDKGVRSLLRDLFGRAANAYKDGSKSFASRLGASLELKQIPYVKSAKLSLREWLAKAWNFTCERKAQIMSFVVGRAVSGKKGNNAETDK